VGGTVHVGLVENKVAMRHNMIPSIFRTFNCRATLKRRTNEWSSRFGNRRHHNRKVMPFSRVRGISKSDSRLRHVYTSAQKNSIPTGGVFMEFIFEYLFQNMSKKIRIHYNLTRIKGTLYDDRNTFSITSLSSLLRIRTVPDKGFTESQTQFMFSNIFPENRAV